MENNWSCLKSMEATQQQAFFVWWLVEDQAPWLAGAFATKRTKPRKSTKVEKPQEVTSERGAQHGFEAV